MKIKLLGPENFNRVLNQKMMLAAIVFAFLLAGCEKEIVIPENGIAVQESTDAVKSQYFNWDNADYMPTPAGHSIHVPWYVGASGSIAANYDADVYSDHKASDGWVMLYSNFSSTTYTPSPYFILYNKYRGLMRIYQYNDNQTLTTSSQVFSGINWAGNGNGSNKVLSFLGNSIVDVNNPKTAYYAVEPSPKNSSELPVHPNKWYMLQYELAYDPSIVKTSSQTPPTLTWYMNYNNITQMSLGGTLKSNVGGSAGSSDFASKLESALTGMPQTVGKIGFYSLGANALSKNPGLPTNFYNSLKSAFTNGLNAATGGAVGTIYGLVSGIFGGSSNSATATMNIDATLTLNGTSTSSGNLLPGTPVYMPGSLATYGENNTYYVTTGQLPVYNSNLGVFNLSGRPSVPSKYYSGHYQEGAGPYNWYVTYKDISLTKIDNSGLIQYNPAVLSYANVEVVQQDVLLIVTNDIDQYTGTEVYIEHTGGSTEVIGNYKHVIVNSSYVGFSRNSDIFYPEFNLEYIKAVRFVIKVTPKYGSKKPSLIVKTFLAN